MEEDHTPSCQISPEPQVNRGIKRKNKSETEDIGNKVRGEIFREIETSDPKNIALMTSNLTLNPENYVFPGDGEIQVLREIYQNEVHSGQDQTPSHDSISSLTSLCNKVVMDKMTCPTYRMLMQSRSRHTVVSGCHSYPFPYTKKTWPLNGVKDTESHTSTSDHTCQ